MPPPRFEKDKSITMALEVLVPSWVVEVKMGIIKTAVSESNFLF
jgi:hypothetical protein